MQFDRKNLEGLLNMNDRQLTMLITRLLYESGIDPSEFNIDPKDISSIRTALSSASDEDINRIVTQYEANKSRPRGGRA